MVLECLALSQSSWFPRCYRPVQALQAQRWGGGASMQVLASPAELCKADRARTATLGTPSGPGSRKCARNTSAAGSCSRSHQNCAEPVSTAVPWDWTAGLRVPKLLAFPQRGAPPRKYTMNFLKRPTMHHELHVPKTLQNTPQTT